MVVEILAWLTQKAPLRAPGSTSHRRRRTRARLFAGDDAAHAPAQKGNWHTGTAGSGVLPLSAPSPISPRREDQPSAYRGRDHRLQLLGPDHRATSVCVHQCTRPLRFARGRAKSSRCRRQAAVEHLAVKLRSSDLSLCGRVLTQHPRQVVVFVFSAARSTRRLPGPYTDRRAVTPSAGRRRRPAAAAPLGGGNAGHLEMAEIPISKTCLEIISNDAAGNGKSPGVLRFPDFQPHFQQNGSSQPRYAAFASAADHWRITNSFPGGDGD
jgi:hypothetical protein